MHSPPLFRPPHFDTAQPPFYLPVAGQIQRPRTITTIITTTSSTYIPRGHATSIDIYHRCRRTLALFCKARLFPGPAEGLAGAELEGALESGHGAPFVVLALALGLVMLRVGVVGDG